jgi:hypothetical protein
MSEPVEHYIGQDVTVYMVVQNPDGTPGNPSTVRFKLKPPVGSLVTLNLGEDGTATVEAGEQYSITFDLDQAGAYKLRAEAIVSDEVVGVDEMVVYSLASLVE